MRKNEFAEIKPLIRSLMAFILYLRFDGMGVRPSYQVADAFIETFEKELPE